MGSKKGPKKGAKKKRPIIATTSRNPLPEDTTAGMVSHKHCLNCGVSIFPDRETCSEKCQTEWDKMVKRKKFWNYLPLIGALFLAFIWLIMLLS
jgi:predicted nucleic acid-binding Zn ribbon protein